MTKNKTTKKKGAGGRPTKYKPEYCQKVDDYLVENQDEVEAVVESENEQTGRTRYDRRFKVRLPTIEGFASYLDVSKQTLYNWSEEHKEFLDSLGKIEREQHSRLVNEGLAGNYNPTIAKLILTNNHGMSEKTETDITSKGEQIGQPDEASQKLIKEYEDKLQKQLK